jgi:hypothetical protein
MIERAAAAAKLGIKARAHMMRHVSGFKLANDEVRHTYWIRVLSRRR